MPTPKSQLNLRKLLKQQLRRITLENTHSRRNRPRRRSRHKQMHMIGVMNPNSQQLKTTLNSNGLKYLLQPVEVRLEEVLKTIAVQSGFQLLAIRVHHADHVHLFVSAPPKWSVPELVRVFKCNSAKLLFEEFPQIRLRLWGGHLWSEGYAVRTAGIVTSAKIEAVSYTHLRAHETD